jgi:catechol 2,3-dioxygenase-like lactoylglutathione lyase family enzyme
MILAEDDAPACKRAAQLRSDAAMMVKDLSVAAEKARALPPPPRIRGVHHTAFRCRDAEQTRAFYEDVLGMSLKASLTFEEEPGTGRPLPYMHLFFQMADGNYVAFFDVPKGATPEKFEMRWGMDLHFAMEVADMAELMAFKARLDAVGIPCFGPIDHHFVHSIYFYDPNGVNVEITCRDAHHDTIMAEESAKARELMAEWSARTAEQKAGQGVL